MSKKENLRINFTFLTENWDSFKHKLNHDLEELGIALKSFVTKPK